MDPDDGPWWYTTVWLLRYSAIAGVWNGVMTIVSLIAGDQLWLLYFVFTVAVFSVMAWVSDRDYRRRGGR
jgi:threonine/homoserine/homoserine lactone efflux protein